MTTNRVCSKHLMPHSVAVYVSELGKSKSPWQTDITSYSFSTIAQPQFFVPVFLLSRIYYSGYSICWFMHRTALKWTNVMSDYYSMPTIGAVRPSNLPRMKMAGLLNSIPWKMVILTYSRSNAEIPGYSKPQTQLCSGVVIWGLRKSLCNSTKCLCRSRKR